MKTTTLLIFLSLPLQVPARDYGFNHRDFCEDRTDRNEEKLDELIELQAQSNKLAQETRDAAEQAVMQARSAARDREDAERRDRNKPIELPSTRSASSYTTTFREAPTEAPFGPARVYGAAGSSHAEKAEDAPPEVRNPYEPNQFPTWHEYMATHKDVAPLDAIRQYRDELNLHILKTGEYDDLVDETNRLLFEHAIKQKWLDGGDRDKAAQTFFAPLFDVDANDAALVKRHSIDIGETELSEAASRFRVFLNDRVRSSYSDLGEYNSRLKDAKLQFKKLATPDKIAAARRASVDREDTPFAVIEDANGTKSLYIGPKMKQYARNDVALAKLFEDNPNLDRNLIGFVRKQIRIP